METKPCKCQKRRFRADLHIEFCCDCAPDKSLSVYREQQQRAKSPELPFAKTPSELRRQAAEIRVDAQYADDASVYRKEIADAERLEREADEIEKGVAA